MKTFRVVISAPTYRTQNRRSVGENMRVDEVAYLLPPFSSNLQNTLFPATSSSITTPNIPSNNSVAVYYAARPEEKQKYVCGQQGDRSWVGIIASHYSGEMKVK